MTIQSNLDTLKNQIELASAKCRGYRIKDSEMYEIQKKAQDITASIRTLMQTLDIAAIDARHAVNKRFVDDQKKGG